ncbi:MAG TPA: TAXI family TRAP transporter solute-binding subunit [Atribacterota bacterium]|nr:TAXI family TRAP transporter solute-binding subunit [Atribacterota bacterium]
MKKRILAGLALVLVLVLLVGLNVGFAETAYLNMGSTSSTSGLYAWAVATASVINKADNNIRVTVIESGAALDNLRRIKDGAFDFALCVDSASAMQLYKGTSTFEGEGWEPIRWLFLRNAITNRLHVRADSGIKTFADLAGKKFCPGFPGASSTTNFVNFNEVTGTGIDLVLATLGDAIDSFKQGKIVGLQKSSSMNSLDSSLIEVNLKTPLAVIGYKEEDMKKIRAEYPYITFFETPAGSIQQLPNNPAIMEELAVVGAVASSKLSEQVGYEIVKAYVEGLEKVAAAYPGIKGWDPIGDSFKLISPGGEIPIHAGLYKYCQEKGIEVPERFIPPECK